MQKKSIIFLSLFMCLSFIVFAQTKTGITVDEIGMRVTKETCAFLSEYPDLGLNQVKDILLLNTKREALSEIYGEMIYSETIIKNWKLISDLIIGKSIGILRIEGNPSYYNGENLGEICVKLNAYVTKEDLKKFKLRSVALTKYCYTNPAMPLKDLKEKARESALQEIVKRLNPALKDISVEHASKLVHNFSILNENFDFSSGAYCMNIKANIIPFEMEFFDPNLTQQDNLYQIEKVGKGGIFYYEDFSKVEEGLLPNNFIGGSTLVVKPSTNKKGSNVLSPFLDGPHQFTVKDINFPQNWTFEIEFKLDEGHWSSIGELEWYLGNLTIGMNHDKVWIEKSSTGYDTNGIKNKISLMLIEKNGDVIKLYINSQKIAVARIQNLEPPKGFSFQYPYRFAIYKMVGKSL